MENKDFEEFEIKIISQSVKRLLSQGFTVDEILGKIATGISEMTSELTAEELYRNERMRNHKGLSNDNN